MEAAFEFGEAVFPAVEVVAFFPEIQKLGGWGEDAVEDGGSLLSEGSGDGKRMGGNPGVDGFGVGVADAGVALKAGEDFGSGDGGGSDERVEVFITGFGNKVQRFFNEGEVVRGWEISPPIAGVVVPKGGVVPSSHYHVLILCKVARNVEDEFLAPFFRESHCTGKARGKEFESTLFFWGELPIEKGVCNWRANCAAGRWRWNMPISFLSITPRIVGDAQGLTATTAWAAQLLMLCGWFRRVRIDLEERRVSIDDRSWWIRCRERVILFDQVAAVTYGYEEWSWTWGARDPIDRFIVGLKLKSRKEVALFWFAGDGTFTNDGILPDWVYWKEIAFDLQGTQEQESRVFARVLSKMIEVTLEPSTLTKE